MRDFKIAEPVNGEISVSLRPCTELIRARDEVKKRLDQAVRTKRLAGYNICSYKQGRINLFYNELVDEGGWAAKHVANEIVEAIYDDWCTLQGPYGTLFPCLDKKA